MNIKMAFSFVSKTKIKLRFLIIFLLFLSAFITLNPTTSFAQAVCSKENPYCNLPSPVAPESINWAEFHSWESGAQREYARRVANYAREQALDSNKTLYEARDEYNKAREYVTARMTVDPDGNKCEDPKVLIDEYTQICNTCLVFGEVFNALSIMSKRVYDAVAPSAGSLIIAVLLVWLAVHVLKAVSSVAPIDSGEFFKSTLTQIFTAGFAYFALTTGSEVFGYVMEPIISGGFNFAREAMEATGGGRRAGYFCRVQSAYGGGIFTPEMHKSLDCLMQELGIALSEIRAVGSTLFCIGFWGVGGGLSGMLNSLQLFATGGIVWVIAIVLILAVPYYLFDSLVRFGIVGAMMPLFLASWAFKITRSFASKGFTMLVQGIMSFIAVTIIIAIDIHLVVSVFTSDAAMIEDVINKGNVAEILEVFDLSGARILLLLAVGFFAFKLLGKSSEIAGHFGGAQFEGVAPRVGGAGIKAAKGAGKLGAMLGLGAVKAGGKVGGAVRAFKSSGGGGGGAGASNGGRPAQAPRSKANTDSKASVADNNKPSALPNANSSKQSALGDSNSKPPALPKVASNMPSGNKLNDFAQKQTAQTQSKKTPHWQTQALDEKGGFMKSGTQGANKAQQQQTMPQQPIMPQAVPQQQGVPKKQGVPQTQQPQQTGVPTPPTTPTATQQQPQPQPQQQASSASNGVTGTISQARNVINEAKKTVSEANKTTGKKT